MIDEQAIESALEAAFDVAERLEAILLAARAENRRAAVRGRIETAVQTAEQAEAQHIGGLAELGTPPMTYAPPVEGDSKHDEGTKVTRDKRPAPDGQEWLTDLADELKISDSQFYVWNRAGHFDLFKHGNKNALRKSDAYRLREIISKKPARYQTNARWVSAWFNGTRD